MILPDLSKYKELIEEGGVVLPLKTVMPHKDGLLSQLPALSDITNSGWPWTEEYDPRQYNPNTKWPKITIVTPSYNQASYLEQTIRSVILQNYPNLEYIVIDGGSNDGSDEILKKYSPWLSYWTSEKDNGQGHAINKGFSLASGDYFAWINSDDYYTSGTFLKVINTFMNTNVMFIYGYGNNASKDGVTLIKTLPLLDYFIKIPSLLQPSTFWNAKIHQPIWEELYCALDFELWLRMVKGKSRKLIKEPLATANVHDDAKTWDPKIQQKWQEDHLKIWSEEGHGTVYEWKKINFLHKIRLKLYRWFGKI